MSQSKPTAAAPVLWKSYLAFLGPMILSNILQAISGTVNNIYLGQMLGVGAMASVSAFFPVLFFLIAFMIGLGSGAAVLIGQAWGARELGRVKAIAGTTLAVGLCAGLAVALFGGTFTEVMLRGLGTPADILPGATTYARVMLFAAPGVFVFLLVTSMLRGVGDTKTPVADVADLHGRRTAGDTGTDSRLGRVAADGRGQRRLRRGGVVPDRSELAGMASAPHAPCAGAGRRLPEASAHRPRPAGEGASHRPADGPVDDHHLDRRDRGAVPGQPLRLAGHGRLRRGEPDRVLRAVSGDLHCHHGLDPGRPRNWRRAGPHPGRDRPHRADDERGADRLAGAAGLRCSRATSSGCSSPTRRWWTWRRRCCTSCCGAV